MSPSRGETPHSTSPTISTHGVGAHNPLLTCKALAPAPTWEGRSPPSSLHLSKKPMRLVVHPLKKPTSWCLCSLQRTRQPSSCEALVLAPVGPSGRSCLPLQPSQLLLLVLSNPSQHPACFVWQWGLTCRAGGTSPTNPTGAAAAQQPRSSCKALARAPAGALREEAL